ncbi:hypothetical protein LM604_04570, partial [Candidatus Acetothermia bacterium]|nr:hypothetical protein [Candidatus Acetothermia bacterium]
MAFGYSVGDEVAHKTAPYLKMIVSHSIGERITCRWYNDKTGKYEEQKFHKNPLLDTPQLAGGRKAEIRRRRIPPLQ